MLIKKPNGVLINAVERHKKNPQSFIIPSPKEIRSLKGGDIVKIGLTIINEEIHDRAAERFWVEIMNIENNNIDFYGRILPNLLFHLNFNVDKDDIILFKNIHIMDIWKSK